MVLIFHFPFSIFNFPNFQFIPFSIFPLSLPRRLKINKFNLLKKLIHAAKTVRHRSGRSYRAAINH